MYFCGYFMLSNDPNWEDFSKISIFGVTFGPNLDFEPLVVPIYMVPPTAIDIEDM